LVEECFQGLAVAQGLAQLRDQLRRHIHTAAAAFVREGKDESRMFVAAGAGRAVGPDAGFADLGQGAFDGGPELLELAEKVLAESRIGSFWMLHGMYILYYTYSRNKKNEKIMARFPAVSEALT
jgi:hypothetical protein